MALGGRRWFPDLSVRLVAREQEKGKNVMRRWIGFCLVAAVAGTLPAQEPQAAAQAGATVTGVVETMQGDPVAGAVVSLQTSAPGVMISRNLMGKTGADGSFSIPGVPDGQYRVCVPWAEGAVLNPCLWGGFPVGVEVAGGAASSARLRVLVAQGAELIVRVADPSGALASANEAALNRPALELFLYRAGMPVLPIRLAGETGAAREYRLVVPVETALTLTISSRDVDLAEAAAEQKDFSADTAGLRAELKLPRDTKRKELRVQVNRKQ